MALSGHSLRRNILSVIGQERTLIGAGGERVTVGAPGSGLFWTKFKPWRRRAAPPDTTAQPQVNGTGGDRVVEVHEGHIALALLIGALVAMIVLSGIFGR